MADTDILDRVDAGLLRSVVSFRGANVRHDWVIDAIGPIMAETLRSYAITTPLRISHFLAQTAHESDGYRTTEEYASGAAYEGRLDLGNTQHGDGALFKGRGLIQLTGRSNYQAYGGLLGVDLVSAPQSVCAAPMCLLVSCEFWRVHDLNALADQDDIVEITHKVNGGTNGLDSRRAYLAAAKSALATPPDGIARAVLRVGASGDAVRDLQAKLRASGASLAIDARLGPATDDAVRAFQRRVPLTADGVVGVATWAALDAATPGGGTDRAPP